MRILRTDSGGISIELTGAALLAALLAGTVLVSAPGIGEGVAQRLSCGLSRTACSAPAPSADQPATVAIDPGTVGDTGALMVAAMTADSSPDEPGEGRDVLLAQHAGTLVAGPAQIGAQAAQEPEFGVSDLDLAIETQQPGGDPGAAAAIGGALAASDCWYFGAGGIFGPTGTLPCAAFSGITGAFSASAGSRAAAYQGGEFRSGTRYCIPGRGCFVAGQAQVEPSDLAGGVVAALPECPFGYTVKGPAGCAIAVGQGTLAYAAGALQPQTEWSWQPSSPSPAASLTDPLGSDPVRDGSQRAVAGLGGPTPLSLTWGTDYRVLGEAAGTGVLLGGVRAYAVTGSPISALTNAAFSGVGYALGSSADQVVTITPLSAEQAAALEAEIAAAQRDLAALEAEPVPVPGPGQHVTPQLLEGLEQGARLRAEPAELGLRLSPVDIERFREVRRQIVETEQAIERLAALEAEPAPVPGPDQHVTPELLEGLIGGLRDQDLENRLAALRRQEQDLLSATGDPGRATVVQVVPGGPGKPAVYEQRSGSAVVCQGGRICLGKFSIVDGQAVELEPVPAPATAAQRQAEPEPGPVGEFTGALAEGGAAFLDSLEQMAGSAAQIPGRVLALPPNPYEVTGAPSPFEVLQDQWAAYGQPVVDASGAAAATFQQGAGLALDSGTRYFGRTLPDLVGDAVGVARDAVLDVVAPESGPCVRGMRCWGNGAAGIGEVGPAIVGPKRVGPGRVGPGRVGPCDTPACPNWGQFAGTRVGPKIVGDGGPTTQGERNYIDAQNQVIRGANRALGIIQNDPASLIPLVLPTPTVEQDQSQPARAGRAAQDSWRRVWEGDGGGVLRDGLNCVTNPVACWNGPQSALPGGDPALLVAHAHDAPATLTAPGTLSDTPTPLIDTAPVSYTVDPSVTVPTLPDLGVEAAPYSVTGWTLEGEQHTISVTDPMTTDPTLTLPPMTAADPTALADFTGATTPAAGLVPDAATTQPAVIPPPPAEVTPPAQVTPPAEVAPPAQVTPPAEVFSDLDLDLAGLDLGIADQAYQVTEFTLDDLGTGGLDLTGPLDFTTTTSDLDLDLDW